MRPSYGDKLFHIKNIRGGILHFLSEIVTQFPHFFLENIVKQYRKRNAYKKHKEYGYVLVDYNNKRNRHIGNYGNCRGENLACKVFNRFDVAHYLRLNFA